VLYCRQQTKQKDLKIMSDLTVNNIENTQQLIDNLPKAGEFLGSVFGWTIANNDTFSIPYHELVEKAVNCNVPLMFLPANVTVKKAFTKALTATKSEYSKKFNLEYIVKPTGADDRYVIGVVKKRVDENEDLDYEQKSKIYFHTDSDIWYCDEPEYQMVVESLKSKFEFNQNIVSEDIRVILRLFVRKYGIRLNPEGGSYFLPAAYQTLAKNIRSLIKELNPNNEVIHINLFSESESNKTLANATLINLEGELEDLETEIISFMSDFKSGNGMLQKGLDSRKQKIEEIKTKIDVFSTVLNFQTDKLEDELGRLRFLIDDSIDVIPVKNKKTSKNKSSKLLTTDNDSDIIDIVVEDLINVTDSDDVGF
jgi:hypothetical protein